MMPCILRKQICSPPCCSTAGEWQHEYLIRGCNISSYSLMRVCDASLGNKHMQTCSPLRCSTAGEWQHEYLIREHNISSYSLMRVWDVSLGNKHTQTCPPLCCGTADEREWLVSD